MTFSLCKNHQNILTKAKKDFTIPVEFLGLTAWVGPTITDTTMLSGTKEFNVTILDGTKDFDAEVIDTRQDTIMINISMLTRTKKVDAGIFINASRAKVNPITPVVSKLIDDFVDLVVRK